MKITVFTPTYNRGYILPKLYDSLLLQTEKSFEWIIVDDGSTDNTQLLVNGWRLDNRIPINYIVQNNLGKHCAINRGVREAKGELFFIVDSDDHLPIDALARVISQYQHIRGKNDFAGVSGIRCHPDGTKVGGGKDFGILECSPLAFRYEHKIKGDMAEVLRTDVLRQYPFPEIEGEKFCPEAVMFNRVSQNYKLRYFFENIYVCDYLPDGLTAKITKIRMQSPIVSMICYSELAHYRVPLIQKIKAAINFWRFSFCSEKGCVYKFKMIGKKWICVLPFGYVMHIKDKKML